MRSVRWVALVVAGLLLISGGMMFGFRHEFMPSVEFYAGPVDGTVTAVDGSEVTFTFVDEEGNAQTGTDYITPPPAVGTTKQIVYWRSNPDYVQTDVEIVADHVRWVRYAARLLLLAIVGAVLGVALGLLSVLALRRAARP